MIDYEKWLERAVAFMEGLKSLPGEVRVEINRLPPLTPEEFQAAKRACPLPIPEALERFLSAGPRLQVCEYWWDTPDKFGRQRAIALPHWHATHIWGGPIVSDIATLARWTAERVGYAAQMASRDQRFWANSLPLISEGDGDYLGLYVGPDVSEPTVAYLSHEGGGFSGILNLTFDEFLEAWERVHYLGPRFLMSFKDRKSDLLRPVAHPVRLEALDSLFRGEVRNDLVAPLPLDLNEDDWLALALPEVLLDWLEMQGTLDLRKLRLFGCACCRRIWSELDDGGRQAIEVTELFADGSVSQADLQTARSVVVGETFRELFGDDSSDDDWSIEKMLEARGRLAAYYAKTNRFGSSVCQAVDGFRFVTWSIYTEFDDPRRGNEIAAQADLVRHIFGNPFRRPERHGTPSTDIVTLANRLYLGEHCAADLMEALRKSGHNALAKHFERLDHPKGCWALDLILGK